MMSVEPLAVVGLDLSLTGTGIAWWCDGDVAVTVHGAKGKDDDPVKVRYRRIATQADVIEQSLPAAEIRMAVVEGPAYAAKGGKPHDRAGLWWHVIGELIERGVEVVVVDPLLLKRFGAQTGNASKMAMIAKAIKRYPDVEIADDNAADAMFLLEIGRRLTHYGSTADVLDDLPALTAISQKALDDIQIAQLSARRGR